MAAQDALTAAGNHVGELRCEKAAQLADAADLLDLRGHAL
jgi:hypothetical protein